MAREGYHQRLGTAREGVRGADGDGDSGSAADIDPPLVVSDILPNAGNVHREGSQYLVGHAVEKPDRVPAPASTKDPSSHDGASGGIPPSRAGRRLGAVTDPLREAGLGAKRPLEADNTQLLNGLKRRATGDIWSGLKSLSAEDLLAAIRRPTAETGLLKGRQHGKNNGQRNSGLPQPLTQPSRTQVPTPRAANTRGTGPETSADVNSSGSEDELPSRITASLSPPVRPGVSATQELVDSPDEVAHVLPLHNAPRDIGSSGTVVNDARSMLTSTTPATPATGTTSTADSPEPTQTLEQANAERSYKTWIDESGRMTSTMGALLPDKYQFHTDPTYPCICPIRSCRRIFRNLLCLGGHFSAGHLGLNLNDNGDGTFSIIGRYTTKTGQARARVVSRNPLDPDEPPMPTPQPPLAKERPLASGRRIPAPERNLMPLSFASPADAASPASPAAAEAIGYSLTLPVSSLSSLSVPEYLTAVFNASYPVDQMVMIGKDLPVLAKLSIKRAAPMDWVRRITRSRVQDPRNHPRPFLALLIHLTGDSSDLCCDTCIPQDGCVVAGKDFPQGLIERLAGCCSTCYFESNASHTKNHCSLMESKPPRKTHPRPKEFTAHGHLLRKPYPKPHAYKTRWTTETNGVSRVLEDVESGSGWSTEEEVLPSTKRGRPTRSVARASAPTARAAAGDETTADPRPVRQQKSRLVTMRMPRSQAAEGSTSPLMLGGSVMSAGALEMEEWEVAPGRIPDEASDEPDNIAFSNSYLTLNQSVPVAAGVGFNVIVLKPGGTTTWEAEGNKMRICSLATGKIGVKMDSDAGGGEVFNLGMNGMFKVKPGASCTVSNRQYIDAVLHVTSLDWE